LRLLNYQRAPSVPVQKIKLSQPQISKQAPSNEKPGKRAGLIANNLQVKVMLAPNQKLAGLSVH
jgi:hypothetical protein